MESVTPETTFDRDAESPSLVYLDAVADFGAASSDAIEAYLESVSHVLADPSADPVEQHLAAERSRAAEVELNHRRAVAQLRSGTATEHDRSREQWTALARMVREKVEVPTVLRLAGIDLRPAGRSRGRDEYSSPCPLCGGADRLRCWSGASGRLWCRRCAWSTDVIGAASLIAGPNFRDILRWLADYAGIPVPEARSTANVTPSDSFEFRRGKMVDR